MGTRVQHCECSTACAKLSSQVLNPGLFVQLSLGVGTRSQPWPALPWLSRWLHRAANFRLHASCHHMYTTGVAFGRQRSVGEDDTWKHVTKIPLMIGCPGGKCVGRTSALVEAIDIMPTILAEAGISAPACPATHAASRATDYCVEGRSLSALLRPVFRLFPPHAPSPHAQGSSGVVATVLLVWRGHTNSTTARSEPGPDLAMWLE